jgi:hypothetical protein
MYYTIDVVFGNGSDMSKIKARYDDEAFYFKDIDALGPFVENHDNPRFLYNHPNAFA